MKAYWMLAPAALLVSLAAAPVMAADEACELTITGNDQMQFDKDELGVLSSCDEVTLTLEHSGEMDIETMGHNWVLTATEDYEDVAQEGMSAGLENDYLPQDDDRIIAHTEVIGGGDSTTITFSTEGLADRDLTFFCSFPGHSSIMKGSFNVATQSAAPAATM